MAKFHVFSLFLCLHSQKQSDKFGQKHDFLYLCARVCINIKSNSINYLNKFIYKTWQITKMSHLWKVSIGKPMPTVMLRAA